MFFSLSSDGANPRRMDQTTPAAPSGAHGHRCPPAARRTTTRAPAWSANDATPSRHLPFVAPAAAVAAFDSYESPRNGRENQIDLIDRLSPADHNVTICDEISAPLPARLPVSHGAPPS
ncbi:hypothetical protein BTK96_001663 [Burkholderia pyrrocinia]|uniref:hypothetical protein n=1 Tax=Burkholderia sp. IT-111MI5 TaxID=3026439 RepID=UPI002A331485|nr:hypothetical protein [Burkholderia pyrrocinia]EKS9894463.1 hypothetical protein [Burkholderia pyrrocinia]EKS9906756.1 hypothetical protein [Burkholderia pyrrocinia]